MCRQTVLIALPCSLVIIAFVLVLGQLLPSSADSRCRDCDRPSLQVTTRWSGERPVTSLEFDRPMDHRSVVEALTDEPATPLDLTWNGDVLQIQLQQASPLTTHYRFNLAGTAVDANGVPLGQDVRWGYHLESPVRDIVRPVRNGDHSTPLAILFHRTMDRDSVEQALRIEPPIPGDLQWGEGDAVVLLTPVPPLPNEAVYAIYLDGSLRDAGGDEFPPLDALQFTTPPAILAASPQGEAINPALVIAILFDRPMDTRATEAAVQIVPEMPGRLTWQETLLILAPDGGLMPSTVYTVTISPAAVDRDGNPILQQPYTWSFRTTGQPDTADVGGEDLTPCEASAGLGPAQEITVRPLLPGSLIAGDRVQLSAIVRNQSVCARRVTVAAASDLLEIEGPITQTIILKSGEQGVANWTARAGEPGEADITIRAVLGMDRDAVHSPMSIQAAPVDPQQTAPAGSIPITREYVDVETGRSVARVTSGQLVRVQISINLPGGTASIVVDDRPPAGLEPLNPEVTATGLGATRYEIDGRTVRFRIPSSQAGELTLDYFALAMYAGEYAAPPAEVASTGSTALWGRSAGSGLTVEPRGRPALASPAWGGGDGWGEYTLSTCVGGTDVPNDEAYDAMFFEEYGVNPFVDTDEDNLSTFAVDVDTGSYTIMRYYVNDGYLPPDESVRVEECVNYFRQDYAPPDAGEGAFAIHLEGAPSLFGGEQHQMVRVGLQGYLPAPEERPDAVLTFVVDVSGSMNRQDRLELVKDALGLLVEELRPGDRIGIAVYSTQARVLLAHTSVSESERILDAIESLHPEDTTSVEEGLRIGYRMAAEAFDPQAINRVILCSDGVANVGRTGADSIWEQIEQYAGQGIYLTTVGFGMGNYNDVLMEQLADQGNGFYAYVDTLAEAERLFVFELPSTLQVIARDARVQVEFNPAVVRSYRLIGYENRDVADEDFRNDEVDAGEIGVGRSATALYEIKLWEGSSTSDTAMTVTVRYENPDTGETAEVSRAITGAEFAATFDTASTRFQMDAVVAEYAEILRGSYWARESSLENVLAQAVRVAQALPGDEDVAEFVHLVERAVEISQQEEAQDE